MKYIDLLRQGVTSWNAMRKQMQSVPHLWDLRQANLAGFDLRGANLFYTNLDEANLQDADLRGADLGRAILGDANLAGADIRQANLQETDLG